MGVLAAIGALCMIMAVFALPVGVICIIAGKLTKNQATVKTGLKLLVQGGIALLLSFSFCSWSGFHL